MVLYIPYTEPPCDLRTSCAATDCMRTVITSKSDSLSYVEKQEDRQKYW